MSKVVTISLKKQLEHVKHQSISKHAQMQDEQQLQPTKKKLFFKLESFQLDVASNYIPTTNYLFYK
jgi:hypothetical protein